MPTNEVAAVLAVAPVAAPVVALGNDSPDKSSERKPNPRFQPNPPKPGVFGFGV